MVLAAGVADADDSRDALAELFQRYWLPVYTFVRRSGHQTVDAQDLTQAFFARMIEKRFVQAADESRGRFRTFLLASLKNFIANEWKKASRQKRGGGAVLSLDFAIAEDRMMLEPVDSESAVKAFERDWAVELLAKVMDRLEDWYSTNLNTKAFDVLRPYLTADSSALPYAQTAEQHGMTVGQVKVSVHRMRSKYRDLLEAEIAETVETADQVQDELRQLFAALQG